MKVIICRRRWILQRFICSAIRHCSGVLDIAGKVLIFKRKAHLCLKHLQCFVDSSPAEDSSNGTRDI